MSVLPRFRRDEKLALALELESCRGLSYLDSKRWSHEFDLRLGLDSGSVEERLLAASQERDFAYARDRGEIRQEFWIGLGAEEMQTPYTEWLEILELARTSSAPSDWVDLGAGFGRLGWVLSLLDPQARYRGFEWVRDRVEAGRLILARFGIDPGSLQIQDLLDSRFELPDASHYFIFDFGSEPARRKILEDLRAKALEHPISVFARGRGIRHQIQQEAPWLSQIVEPVHRPSFSWYRSREP